MKKVIIILTLFLLTGCTVFQPASTATPVSTATSIPPTAAPEKKPDWTFAAGGAIWSPITVSGGVVYFGSDDSTLYAVNATTHALVWKFQTGGEVRSQLAVSKDLVFAASDDGYLYAVAIDKGTQAWKTQIGKSIKKRNAQYNAADSDYFTSSPTLQDNMLYIGGTDNNLYAIDAATGNVKWKFTAASASTMIRCTPVVGNGMVYFSDYAGNFYAVDITNGTQAWVYATNSGTYGNGATLVDQTIYIPAWVVVVALDAKIGKEKWKAPNMYAFKIPAYEDGVLYTDGFKDNKYYLIGAYDAASGKSNWVVDLPCRSESMENINLPGTASAALGKNNLYISTYCKGLFAIDKKSGAIQWVIPVGAGTTNTGSDSTAAVADGMVYFGGTDGILYAVKDQ